MAIRPDLNFGDPVDPYMADIGMQSSPKYTRDQVTDQVTPSVQPSYYKLGCKFESQSVDDDIHFVVAHEQKERRRAKYKPNQALV